MSTIRESIIRFVTRSDGAGAREAEASVTRVGVASDKAGQQAASAGKQSADASRGMQAMGQAAAAGSGSVSEMASALGNMSKSMGWLSGAMGWIGLIGAAFMTWKKVVDLLADAHKRLRDSVLKIQDDNISNRLARQKEAYDSLTKAMDDAAAARERLSAAEDKVVEAAAKARVKALEAEREAKKAELKPDDELGRRKLDVSYADQIAQTENSAQSSKLSSARASVDNRLRDTRTMIATEKSRKQALLDDQESSFGRVGSLQQQGQDYRDAQLEKATKAMRMLAFSGPIAGGLDPFGLKKKIVERYAGSATDPKLDESIAKAIENQKSINKQLTDRDTTISQLEDRLQELERERDVIRFEGLGQAADVSKGASARTMAKASVSFDESKANAAEQAARIRAQAEREKESLETAREQAKANLSAAQSPSNPLLQSARRERSEADFAATRAGATGSRRDRDTYNVELKQAERAEAAAQSAIASMSEALARIERDLKLLDTKLKNAPIQ